MRRAPHRLCRLLTASTPRLAPSRSANRSTLLPVARALQQVVILSGDHLYRMDYMKFVNYHRETNADVTIGCIPYGSDRAKEFGLMKIDKDRRVLVRPPSRAGGGR